MARIALLAATGMIAVLAASASAQAATYYVTSSGSGTACTQAAPCATITAAITAHRLAPTSSDVVDVGPGTFVGFRANNVADDGLTVQGTLVGGARATTLRPAAGTTGFSFQTVYMGRCSATAPTSVTLRDANVDAHGADTGVGAIELDGNSSLVNVHAENQPGSGSGAVIWTCENGGSPSISQSQIVAADYDYGIAVLDELTITDSTIDSTSVEASGLLQFLQAGTVRPVRVTRTRVSVPANGGYAAVESSGDLTLDSSLLTGGTRGVLVDFGGTFDVVDSTIDAGVAGADDAASLVFDVDPVNGPATVGIDSSILSGPIQIVNLFGGGGETGTITCGYSNVTPPAAHTGWTFDCATGPGSTNTSTAASLLFAGGSPFSWALLPSAPAIDAGNPAALGAGVSTTDLLGHARVLHGTAAGCPDGVRDMGAYEAADVVCPPAVVVAPTVERSSTPKVGTKLGAYGGGWSGAPTSYAMQWVRCDADGTSNCADIAGRTHSTYIPVTEDLDHTLRVRVVAGNAGGSSNPATSAPSGVVTLPAPGLLKAPTVERSATPKVGTKLGAYRGVWSYSPTSYAFQWVRCDGDGTSNCADIAGRTNSTYIPVAADVDHRLRVRVMATNLGGSTPATSAPSGIVAVPTPTLVEAPTVERSSAPVVGVKLGTYSGAWSPTPDSYERQWLRCDGPQVSDCTAIAGRTGSTYIAAAADVGKRLRIRIVAVNDGGSSTPATSAASGVVS